MNTQSIVTCLALIVMPTLCLAQNSAVDEAKAVTISHNELINSAKLRRDASTKRAIDHYVSRAKRLKEQCKAELEREMAKVMRENNLDVANEIKAQIDSTQDQIDMLDKISKSKSKPATDEEEESDGLKKGLDPRYVGIWEINFIHNQHTRTFAIAPSGEVYIIYHHNRFEGGDTGTKYQSIVRDQKLIIHNTKWTNGGFEEGRLITLELVEDKVKVEYAHHPQKYAKDQLVDSKWEQTYKIVHSILTDDIVKKAGWKVHPNWMKEMEKGDVTQKPSQSSEPSVLQLAKQLIELDLTVKAIEPIAGLADKQNIILKAELEKYKRGLDQAQAAFDGQVANIKNRYIEQLKNTFEMAMSQAEIDIANTINKQISLVEGQIKTIGNKERDNLPKPDPSVLQNEDSEPVSEKIPAIEDSSDMNQSENGGEHSRSTEFFGIPVE